MITDPVATVAMLVLSERTDWRRPSKHYALSSVHPDASHAVTVALVYGSRWQGNPATHPTASLSMTVPTVDEVLARCDLRSFDEEKEQLLDWDGCAVPVGKLRQALEDAYDPLMPNWPAMVEIGDV